jgi:hypothetical protein
MLVTLNDTDGGEFALEANLVTMVERPNAEGYIPVVWYMSRLVLVKGAFTEVVARINYCKDEGNTRGIR